MPVALEALLRAEIPNAASQAVNLGRTSKIKNTMFVAAGFAAAGFALSLSAGWAFAGEGNGDPFPFRANPHVATGPAFVADTGSSAYPQPTGNRVQLSSLAQLEPAPGSEAPIQTAHSLPRGAGQGTVAYAQMQSLHRYWAARSASWTRQVVLQTRPWLPGRLVADAGFSGVGPIGAGADGPLQAESPA